MRNPSKPAALFAMAVISSVQAAPPARAGYIVIFSEVGSDVVANGSGSLDLAALQFGGFSVPVRRSFQLPTISAPTMAPSMMSVSRDSPRHMTMLPGGGSLARAR
jgi:hypothetical protein